MEIKSGKACAICGKIKQQEDYPPTKHPLIQSIICLACQEDEGGGGGYQSELSQNAKQLQYEIELKAALQKELENQKGIDQKRDIFGAAQRIENERKKQAAQRELLDLKEDITKTAQENDEPNPDLAFNTQTRREKITRLFSITRSLARNYVTANNAKAAAQKNFSLFSHIKENKIVATTERTDKANTNKALLAESATLFSQTHSSKESSSDEVEKLINAIREGQKIFNK